MTRSKVGGTGVGPVRVVVRAGPAEGIGWLIVDLVVLYCPDCARDCFAETPPCPDGHGTACPDRACVDCGTALLLDVAVGDLVPRRRVPRRAA